MMDKTEVIEGLVESLLVAAHQYRNHPYKSAADGQNFGLQM